MVNQISYTAIKQNKKLSDFEEMQEIKQIFRTPVIRRSTNYDQERPLSYFL